MGDEETKGEAAGAGAPSRGEIERAAEAALKDYAAGVEALRAAMLELGVAVLKLRRVEEAAEALKGTDAENAPAEAREQFLSCVWTLVSFLVASRWSRELADKVLDDFIERCDLALRVIDKVEAGQTQEPPSGVQ